MFGRKISGYMLVQVRREFAPIWYSGIRENERNGFVHIALVLRNLWGCVDDERPAVREEVITKVLRVFVGDCIIDNFERLGSDLSEFGLDGCRR